MKKFICIIIIILMIVTACKSKENTTTYFNESENTVTEDKEIEQNINNETVLRREFTHNLSYEKTVKGNGTDKVDYDYNIYSFPDSSYIEVNSLGNNNLLLLNGSFTGKYHIFKSETEFYVDINVLSVFDEYIVTKEIDQGRYKVVYDKTEIYIYDKEETVKESENFYELNIIDDIYCISVSFLEEALDLNVSYVTADKGLATPDNVLCIDRKVNDVSRSKEEELVYLSSYLSSGVESFINDFKKEYEGRTTEEEADIIEKNINSYISNLELLYEFSYYRVYSSANYEKQLFYVDMYSDKIYAKGFKKISEFDINEYLSFKDYFLLGG